jgi:hypothetical protein
MEYRNFFVVKINKTTLRIFFPNKKRRMGETKEKEIEQYGNKRN